MLLKAYLKTLPDAEARAAFALRCGTSIGHLRNVIGGKSCSHILAARIETNSHGQVTRQELCPDWREVWPELVPAKKPKRVAVKAPTVAKKASAARPAADQRSGEERRKSPLVVIPDLRKGPRRQEH